MFRRFLLDSVTTFELLSQAQILRLSYSRHIAETAFGKIIINQFEQRSNIAWIMKFYKIRCYCIVTYPKWSKATALKQYPTHLSIKELIIICHEASWPISLQKLLNATNTSSVMFLSEKIASSIIPSKTKNASRKDSIIAWSRNYRVL